MTLFLQRYSRFALLNLFIVALIGVILRYKIAFALPFIDQRNLLHGHSHFAFSGWITHALMLMLVANLASQKGEEVLSKFRWLLDANLFTAYGMLIFFPLQGYALMSILFSTLSIFVSYTFAIKYWKALNSLAVRSVSQLWIKASLLFSALSSLGAFSLAIMMATKTMHENWYLASVYFFLHFQYNGWFFFACMGLAMQKFFVNIPEVIAKRIFWLFALACPPAYLLSALWLPMPVVIYCLVVAAAFCQVAAWWFVIRLFKQENAYIRSVLPVIGQRLMMLSAIAFSIKLLLQMGSTIPYLSKLAFGFRPIVIGYLHLILLGVITLFIIGYLISEKMIALNKVAVRGVVVFTVGIIINELFLMTQGFAALDFLSVPFINELLLGAALIIFSGIFILNLSQKKSRL
jgi:hypothetical protein